MIAKIETAVKVAELLLKIKAIKLQPDRPFTWTSGWKSPVYCDNRGLLSVPSVRTFVRQSLSSLINEEFGSVSTIVGVAVSGIPHGVLVAQELGLPFAFVRSEAKKHGMKNIIEGTVNPGERVVVVEDLISTGKSSLTAVNALRDAGCTVAGVVCIFDYEFPQSAEAFKKAKCVRHSLCNYHTMIDVALENGYVDESFVDSLTAWRENPASWGTEQKPSISI